MTSLKPDTNTKTYAQQGDDSFAFMPFCCVQQTKELNRVGFVFVCTVEDKEPVGQESEVKDVRWMKKTELRKILEETPENIFTFQVGALGYYMIYGEDI